MWTGNIPLYKQHLHSIHLCKGMATDTLEQVLKERFENWMRSRGLDINSMRVWFINVSN